MKLSDKQKEVIGLMRKGRSLFWNTVFNIYIPIKRGPDIKVAAKDFSFLMDNELIEYEGKFSIMTDIYSLTDLGKTIELK